MLEKTGDVNTPLEKSTNTFCDLALEMDEKSGWRARKWSPGLPGPPMDNLRTVVFLVEDAHNSIRSDAVWLS